MKEDDVLREVRTVREAFAASHGYDIRSMVSALRQFGCASGMKVVSLHRRPPSPIATPPVGTEADASQSSRSEWGRPSLS